MANAKGHLREPYCERRLRAISVGKIWGRNLPKVGNTCDVSSLPRLGPRNMDLSIQSQETRTVPESCPSLNDVFVGVLGVMVKSMKRLCDSEDQIIVFEPKVVVLVKLTIAQPFMKRLVSVASWSSSATVKVPLKPLFCRKYAQAPMKCRCGALSPRSLASDVKVA